MRRATANGVERRVWMRLGVFALGFLCLVWLLASGAFHDLHLAGIERRLREAGPWGMATFLVLFVVLQPFGASGHVFVLASALVWPKPVAFGLSLVGAVIGQSFAFLFYRYLAQDWAQRRVPRFLLRYEHALAEKPLRSVFLLRILAFTAPPLSALLGLSRVRFAPMIIASAFGLMPTIAFDVWLGADFVAKLFD